jgi:hypothetical protein
MKPKYNKKEQIVIDIINLMFKIAGHEICFDDALEMEDGWYNEFIMTEEQNKEWREQGEKLIRKKLKYLTKEGVRKEMDWVNSMWGLKIKEQ